MARQADGQKTGLRLGQGAAESAKRPASGAGRRQAVIDAAARLFRDQGYERTTVRDIGKAVNLHSGSLFYHFDTKEDLLLAVITEGTQRALDTLQSSLEAVEGAENRLRALIRGHLAAMHEAAPAAMAVVFREFQSLSPRGQRKVVKQRDAYEKCFRDVLSECAQAGLIPSDDRMYELFLLGALNWTIQWFNKRGDMTIDQLADRFVTFIQR